MGMMSRLRNIRCRAKNPSLGKIRDKDTLTCRENVPRSSSKNPRSSDREKVCGYIFGATSKSVPET